MDRGRVARFRDRAAEAGMVSRSLRDVVSASPVAFLALACCQALQGITPAGFILTIAAVASGRLDSLWLLLPIVGVLLLLADGVETYALMLVTNIREKTEIVLQGRLLQSTALWPDLDIFERPDLIKLRLEAKQAAERSGRVVLILTNLMAGVLGLVPLILIATRVSPWIALLSLAGLIPVTLSSLRLEERVWSAEKDHLAQISLARNLAEVGEAVTFAKDVRSLTMGTWIVRCWREERLAVYRAIARVRTYGAVKVTLLSLLSVGFSIGGLVLAVGSTWEPGSVVIVLGVLLQMRSQMYAVVGNISQLGEIWSPLSSLARYADMVWPLPNPSGPSERRTTADQRQPAPDPREGVATVVDLTGVTFTYPGARQPTLREVNFEIRADSSLAIVGPNGAGKSTLLKLLAQLYSPDEGVVSIAGGSCAVMHQDFSRFPLTLRDNLTAGQGFADDELLDALGVVGLTNWVMSLPERLDTRLYKQGPDDGTLLSGGQWQRLGLARTALRARGSAVVLFDEPTSALDPEAEESVMSQIQTYIGPKATVWVTHRMNHAARCDVIGVIEEGRISAWGLAPDVFATNRWFRDAYESQRRGFALL